jgi:hypothetical protein
LGIDLNRAKLLIVTETLETDPTNGVKHTLRTDHEARAKPESTRDLSVSGTALFEMVCEVSTDRHTLQLSQRFPPGSAG